MRKLIAIISLLFFHLAIAQKPNEKGVSVTYEKKSEAIQTGNTYALIIGISKYQNFPSLQFADNDARAFYSFLVSGTSEKVDSSNIRIIINERARAGDIWREFGWLTRKAVNKGDKVFIYFSGHGDAANAEEAYLLAYDAPNEGDPNLYNAGGTFQIYNLKTKIKQLSDIGVQVVLITDACRTNELPGKADGSKWTYNKIMERQSGEIQMTSCATNEKSIESTKWGNGRGLFSWHLINGLYGIADNDPEDGNLTLYELQKYVKENVRNDSRNETGTPAQNPMFCCNDMENSVICHVKKEKKNEVFALLNNPMNTDANLFALNTSRNAISEYKKFGTLYSKFSIAIAADNLISNDNTSASYNYYEIMKIASLDADTKRDLHDEYVAALVNFAQQRINNYLSGKNSKLYTYDYFMKAAEALNTANQLINDQSEQAKVIMKTKYMLEARAQSAAMIYHDFHENKNMKDRMEMAMKKLDSAKYIVTTALNALWYHTYSLTMQASNNFSNSVQYELEALKIAPGWKYPYNTLGYVYSRMGKYDSAIYYYNKCIELDPEYKTAYNNIGLLYMNQNKYELAGAYFNKCLSLDPSYTNAILNTGLLYYRKKMTDSAEYYYQKSIQIDPAFSNAYFNLGSLYYNKKDFDKAKVNFSKCVELDANFGKAYFALSCIYASANDMKPAASNLESALKAGFNDKQTIETNSDLGNFRTTAEYKNLMKKYSVH